MQNLDNSVETKTLKSEKQKELYIATLVHDLKNPLNSQIVALEQLLKEKFGAINLLQREILNDIISSAKFMREMLSSLLSVYKFENGGVNLNKTSVDMNKLIKICIKDLISLADEHCVLINYIDNSNNNIFLCDENYIRRAISNILYNLIIYSYKNTNSFVCLYDNETYMIISFKSKGFPIEENFKKHIFEKYTSCSRKKSGTGLGLYFCKQVVEAHGGTIELKADNSDIEFIISLPKTNSGRSEIKFV